MAINTSSTTSPDGARTGDGRDQGSPLDRSRAKAKHAQEALAEARRQAEEFGTRLEQNVAKAGADENALGAALDQVKRLKKALKDGEKERQKLIAARRRASAEVEKAEGRARKAEAKYDRAVLADLIERQKEQDRVGASAGTGGDAERSPAGAERSAVGADRSPVGADRSPVGADRSPVETDAATGANAATGADASPNGGSPTSDTGVEPEDLATATARTTAARTTAASAGEEALPAPTPPTPRRSTGRARSTRPTSRSPQAQPSSPDNV